MDEMRRFGRVVLFPSAHATMTSGTGMAWLQLVVGLGVLRAISLIQPPAQSALMVVGCSAVVLQCLWAVRLLSATPARKAMHRYAHLSPPAPKRVNQPLSSGARRVRRRNRARPRYLYL